MRATALLGPVLFMGDLLPAPCSHEQFSRNPCNRAVFISGSCFQDNMGWGYRKVSLQSLLLEFLQAAGFFCFVLFCFLPFCRSYCVPFTLFHVFQFSCHIPVLPFSTFYSVFWHILGPRLWISHFPRFSVFITIFQVLQCVFLILPPFSVFLAIYQVLQCAVLIFLICHFSCHIQDPTVCVSHFSRFSVFSPYSI